MKPYVEVPKIAKRDEKVNAYKPPHKRNEETVGRPAKAPELPKTTEPEKVEKSTTPVDKSTGSTGRPFDKTIPINQEKLAGSSAPEKPKPIQKLVQKKPKMHPLLANIPDTREPIVLTGIEEAVVDKILHGEISLNVLEAAAIAPAVKPLLKRKLNNLNVQPRRRKVSNNAQTVVGGSESEEVYFALEDLEQPTIDIFMQNNGDLPLNAIVHRDIVEQFLKDRPEERGKKIIIVGKPSDDLRVTYPIINGSNQMVECIMDNGSQIVSMDTRVASGLHLSWDPDVVIHMQSANGNLNRMKGLARNVPFKFGDLVVYLQVHVIDNCPYELLVGRPFDVLCETTVQNTQTGDQFITIHDPNSDRRCTIPTYARGQKPEILLPPENKLVPMGPVDGPPPSTGPVEHNEPRKNEDAENQT
ncbi:hypothetical protein K435DRAFT_656697 [Dendrothele bispora CBS 962.96]|uniref:Aspartic peptidase DDI1-type domain-containing protein n=1 Tax=Dendrothele bispora (strain CBS 962.96) TaxID=1314807 RepID=A0A4S8MDP9_DENBC|nr:hypothetical protein K435DRAFT_656697 [Dendrothele bispora CBS 962.96]